MTGAPRALGRVLVTGAQGFLGSALVTRLRATGNEVTATDVGGDGITCDVTDFAQVEAVVRGGYGTIFHCGAVSGPMVLADQPLAIWRINALGTAHVLEAARRYGVGRVVVCSTSEVYGPCAGPVDERSLPHPTSVYAASKLAAEAATLGYVREHGLDAVALRLSWIYGPGRRTPTTLEKALRAVIAGRQARFASGPDAITHYLWIDDAVTGLLCAGHAAALTECVYNITAGVGIPVRIITDTLSGLRPQARFSLRPDGDAAQGPSVIDNGRAAAQLGFHPATTLEAGLDAYLRALAG